MKPKHKALELTSITIVVVILVITAGTVAIGFLLFQQLDESAKQVGALKVRKEFSPDPLVEGVQFLGEKNTMETDHPLSEKLFRQGQHLQKSERNFRGAIAAYEPSIKQYLKDIGPKKLDASDKHRLALRYQCIADCLVHTNDLRGALKLAKLATEMDPSSTRFSLLGSIYDALNMPAEAQEAYKHVKRQPTKSEITEDAWDLVK